MCHPDTLRPMRNYEFDTSLAKTGDHPPSGLFPAIDHAAICALRSFVLSRWFQPIEQRASGVAHIFTVHQQSSGLNSPPAPHS